jgi:hypothetical protein
MICDIIIVADNRLQKLDMIELLVWLLVMSVCGGVNGHVWYQRYDDIDGEAKSDQSGSAVAISGDGTTMAVGATFNDDTDDTAGHVRVFRDDGATWLQLGDDIDGEMAFDNSVRLVGGGGESSLMVFRCFCASLSNLDADDRAVRWRCRTMATPLQSERTTMTA